MTSTPAQEKIREYCSVMTEMLEKLHGEDYRDCLQHPEVLDEMQPPQSGRDGLTSLREVVNLTQNTIKTLLVGTREDIAAFRQEIEALLQQCGDDLEDAQKAVLRSGFKEGMSHIEHQQFLLANPEILAASLPPGGLSAEDIRSMDNLDVSMLLIQSMQHTHMRMADSYLRLQTVAIVAETIKQAWPYTLVREPEGHGSPGLPD